MHWGVAVLLPIGIGAVFVIAGVTKLPRTAETLWAMRGFRVPAGLRKPIVARALAVVEIVIGGIILAAPGPVSMVGLSCAIGLTLGFSALIVGVLARGDDVRCNCFGEMTDRPLTRWSLARNLVIVAATLAAILLRSPVQGVPDSVRALSPDDRLWLMLVLALGFGSVFALRSQRRLRDRIDDLEHGITPLGPPLPRPIPSAVVADRRGVTTELATLATERAQLLVFLRVGCPGCLVAADHMDDWSSSLAPGVDVRAATTATYEAFTAVHPTLGDTALFEANDAIAMLNITAVPSAVLLGTNGIVAAGPLAGVEAIDELVSGIREVLVA